jgi:hypothetical protein
MKYVPGLMVGQLSGKAGSTVASRGRFGSYFRTRNMPTNPNTLAQQTARDRLSYISKGWSTLTNVERASWDSAAAAIPIADTLGAIYYQSGFDYFCGVNSYLSVYSGANTFSTLLPAAPAPAAIATAALTFVGGTSASLAYTTTPLAAGTKMVIECTAPMSPGRSYIRKSDYRQIFITAAAAASPADIFSAYEARFGDTTSLAGKVVHFRVYALNAEGSRSAFTSGSATIS